MKICGIVAEYDPFHTGHARQIMETRRVLGSDCAIVCVMSGNWTQRGGPAFTDKHLRTRFALMGGADLVLELPLPYAISSAEWFAYGAVSILNATGIMTHLSFGSEWGDLSPLLQTAQCLDSDPFRRELRIGLDRGLSFPAARQQAVQCIIGETAACLSHPNNNLGVEYLRALNRLGSAIEPLTIQREGAGHGQAPSGGFSSASHLRQLIADERWSETQSYLLPGEMQLLQTAARSDCRRAERAILYRLRQMSAEELSALPDCGEGLSNRLYRAIRQGTTVDEILMLAKTKRYPHARLRRVLLWAYLGLTTADRPDVPPYLRVLGMNDTGRTLLRTMNDHADLPVLTKPAHVRSLSPQAQALFDAEARATDLYELCLPKPSPCGIEWTRGPILL